MSKLFCLKVAGLLLAGGMVGCPATVAASDVPVDAYLVDKLWPGDSEPIPDAVMLVRDGKVVEIGAQSEVKIPDDAVRHEMPGVVIVPGFVIAETSLGIAADDERTLTPEVRAVDGFDPFADYSRLIAAGITTVQISPGRQRLMPGQGAVVKLAGKDLSARVLQQSESLRVVLSSESANPPSIYEPPVGAVSVDNPLEPSRAQIAESLAARVAGLRAVFRAATADTATVTPELDLQVLRECLQRRRLRISVRTAAEIRAALSLFADLERVTGGKLKLVLSGPTELSLFLENPEQLNVDGIILNPGIRPGQVTNPSSADDDDRPVMTAWETAHQLLQSNAGTILAISPDSDSDLDDVLFLAGLFTRSGTSSTAVLRMLTANPARMLGVDGRVGTLRKDHDADFVALSGDPFAQGTVVQATWIDGQQEFSRDVADHSILVRAAAVYPGDGTVIAGGAVVVSGGTVRAVGSSVSVPPDAETRTFPGAVIVPGFIDLATGLGFGGPLSGIKLSTTLGDRLASDDPDIAFARQGGVTTAVYSASGSPAPMLAFKLGDTPRLLREPVGIRFSVPSNLTAGIPALKRTLAAGKAYADSWTKYDRDLADYQEKLKDYESELAKYEAKQKADAAAKAKADADKEKDPSASGGTGDDDSKTSESDNKDADSPKPESDSADAKDSKSKKETEQKSEASTAESKPDPDAPKKPDEPQKPKENADLEPYRKLFASQIPAVVEASSVNAIEAALTLFRDELGLRTILVGSDDAWRLSEVIAAKDAAMSLGPVLVRRVEGELINLPQVMANAGVRFGFQSGATTGVQQLPLAVQYSVFRGLGTTDAVQGLTQSPAKLLSLEEHVGSIAIGRDADLVVLSGPPFELSTEILAVMIDGEWVYERSAE